MDDASIDRLAADLVEGDGTDGLLVENQQIVEAFLICQTQWRVTTVSAGFSARPIYLGFDYASCRVALEAMGVAIDRELWAGLMLMEHEAANALNEVGQ